MVEACTLPVPQVAMPATLAAARHQNTATMRAQGTPLTEVWRTERCCLINKSCLTLLLPHGMWPGRLHSPGSSSIRRILQARILEWVAILPPKDLSDLGIKPASKSGKCSFSNIQLYILNI